jgi:transposase-like protein
MKCPKCGSENVKRNGHDFKKAGANQKYACLDCGNISFR